MQKDKNPLGFGKVILKWNVQPWTTASLYRINRICIIRKYDPILNDIFPGIRVITHSAGGALGCLPPGNGGNHFPNIERV